MLRRTRRPQLDEARLATAWQLISLLLDYPTEHLGDRRALLEEAAHGLPPQVRDPLVRFLDSVADTPLGELQRDYVDTFDVTRRCSLYLTYAAHGDTRRRGLALVQLKQAYRRAGAELDTDELPDHLCVVLEFGACCDLDLAWRLLGDHRAAVEMLRIALADRGSRWHDLVLALCATLPDLEGDDAEKVQRLVAEGPPSEDVGLDQQPYAVDPRLNPHPTLGPGDSVDTPRHAPSRHDPPQHGPTIRVGAP